MSELDRGLFDASSRGDLTAVAATLSAGACVDFANEHGWTPLCIAAFNGHTAVVERLLVAGANANVTTRNGSSSLFLAAQQGHVDCVERLLAAGGNVELARINGCTPLGIAASNGHTAVVQALLVAGADVNLCTTGGLLPLAYAAASGHVTIARIFIDAGASVNALGGDGDSPLLCAALKGHEDIAHILVEAGADPFVRNKQGVTAIEVFESNGHAATARLLSEFNPSSAAFIVAVERNNIDFVRRFADPSFVTARGEHGRTPLHQAAKHQHTEIIQVLLEHGAKVNARDDQGWTSLHVACTTGNLDVITLLLEKGANPSSVDDHGLSCVDIGAMNGNLEALKMLVGHGAVLTSRAIGKRTVLHHGVIGRNSLLVEYVLNNDPVDVNAVDDQGFTALHYAVQSLDLLPGVERASGRIKQHQNHSSDDVEENDRLAVLRVLVAVDGVDINALTNMGESALLIASGRNNTHAVRLVLDRGAQTDVRDHAGRTPLSVATSPDIRSVLQLYHTSQQYHERCFALISNQATPPSRDQISELLPLITSVYDVRLVFTLASLSTDTSCLPVVLKAALDHIVANKLTFDDDACVFFKLVLEKCERDKIISREDFLLLDRKAEKANTESADWVVEMKKQVYTNSWRLEAHEHHLRSVVDGVKQMHAMVLENRAVMMAAAGRVEQLRTQVIAGKKLLGKLMIHTKHTSTQVTHLQKRLTQTDNNVRYVAKHLTDFRDTYLKRLEQEKKNSRVKRVCGVVASVAGFIIGPVLKEISDAVVDFTNPIDIVSTLYGERDIAGFLADQSNKVLPEVIKSQLEKYAISEEEFETVLREEIALLHPEIVAECEERGMVPHVDGGQSEVVTSVLVPSLEAEESSVSELLQDLHAALRDGSSKPDVPESVGYRASTPGESRENFDFSPSAQHLEALVGKLTEISVVPPTDTAEPTTQPDEEDVTRPLNQDPTPPRDQFDLVLLTSASSSPYHVAVKQSQGDITTFKTLISTLSTDGVDVMVPAEIELRSTITSRDNLSAVEYAYARGYRAVGDYLAAQMPHSATYNASQAVSVLLLQPADAFAYVCVVDESGGDVGECKDLCELMDVYEDALEAVIEADVKREVVETVAWTPVEYACHLGYVDIVKFMVKEFGKTMAPKQRIEMLKRARERAALAGVAA